MHYLFSLFLPAAVAGGPVLYTLAREGALIVFVVVMVMAIATLTGGETQNVDLGPVAIRQHVRRRSSLSQGRSKHALRTKIFWRVTGGSAFLRSGRRKTVRDSIETIWVPHSILPTKNDGVVAACSIYYEYEAGGRLRKKKLVTLQHVQMRVSATAIPMLNIPGGRDVAQPDIGEPTLVRGSEIDASFRYSEVYLPEVQVETDLLVEVLQTEENALAYANRIEYLKHWQGDDALRAITMSSDLVSEVAAERRFFLQSQVERVRRLRNAAAKSPDKINLERPTVIGNYVIRLSFSKNPLFVLTRHPDRDIRITAWLTVLTSLFAMFMEAWPMHPG